MSNASATRCRSGAYSTSRIKVNDRRGSQGIGAVVVWRGRTRQAASASMIRAMCARERTTLRHLASRMPATTGKRTVTLRNNVDEVSAALKDELGQRLVAGVVVEEARLTHLAYAPEIAQAMLRRQQAEAIIDARQKIVHGAVSMVDMALRDLAEKNVIELDPERKASMISNLMVVLCGESEVHPIVNAGTLYS